MAKIIVIDDAHIDRLHASLIDGVETNDGMEDHAQAVELYESIISQLGIHAGVELPCRCDACFDWGQI